MSPTATHDDGAIICTTCAATHIPRGTLAELSELGDCGRTAARDGWECADCGATLLDGDVWASLHAIVAESAEASC